MFTRILSEDIGAIMTMGLLIGSSVALSIVFLAFRLLRESTMRRIALAVLISIPAFVVAIWLFITILSAS